jgi:hypothetical protein
MNVWFAVKADSLVRGCLQSDWTVGGSRKFMWAD